MVRCTVVRMTPLVPKDDTKVPVKATGSEYSGPKCFSFVRVDDYWKQEELELGEEVQEFRRELEAVHLERNTYLTVCHGYGNSPLRGISHDLSEGREYILFLTKKDSGLFRLTDCNSVYPIVKGKVPDMGINMLDADVLKNRPTSLAKFKTKIWEEMKRQENPKSPDRK
ncbi:MAG: hypothetical protein AAF394_02255 [Planctomycetota bacterium]